MEWSASAVTAMQSEGRDPEARERYADLVGRHQRRASRIASHYLRNGAEADEAVQDAFVQAYTHLASLPADLSFEVWLNRILINGCLDRIKARTPRRRWLVASPEPSPGQKLASAVARLPERQRLVFMLSHHEGLTPPEVSAVTGLNSSTVRVHLLRAIQRLRTRVTERGMVHL